MEANFTIRIQEMEERISGVKDTVGKRDSSVKEHVRTKNLLTQNMQKTYGISRDYMERPNVVIIGSGEDETQFKGPRKCL